MVITHVMHKVSVQRQRRSKKKKIQQKNPHSSENRIQGTKSEIRINESIQISKSDRKNFPLDPNEMR